jgi:16S rRNA (cytosine967-C5)-methyltransferase
MRNKGHLVATDTHAGRLARAKQRLKRNGVENAECLVPDSKWYKTKRGRFDRVLIDAPCTGSGAWAHNPDQRWRLDEEALARLVGEQDALLDKSAPMVRPGGRLIYATCSFLLEENEDRVAAFLARNAEFRLEPAADVWAEAGLPSWPCHDRNIVRLSPYRHGTSGFFAAVMVRRPLAIRPE